MVEKNKKINPIFICNALAVIVLHMLYTHNIIIV